MIQGYDGDALLSQLEALTAPQRRAFSTACAEVLLLHFASVSTVGHSAGTEECERVVHFCWDAVERGALESGPSETVDLLRAGLEEILSQDEEGELEAMEHVIAGAYYALASSRAGDAGRAELVAKNLYEAADYTIVADRPQTLPTRTRAARSSHRTWSSGHSPQSFGSTTSWRLVHSRVTYAPWKSPRSGNSSAEGRGMR